MGDQRKRAPSDPDGCGAPALDAVAIRVEQLSSAVAEQTERLIDEQGTISTGDLAQILDAARRSSELARELVTLARRERDSARLAMLGPPRSRDEGTESEPVRSRRRLRGSVAGKSFVLLVVDDEPLLLKTLCRMLEPWPHRVLAAASVREALEIAEREETLDVLVTDFSLPGMTGSELAQRIRAGRPRLRVLYTSGWDAASSGVTLAADGSEAFLAKPFTATELAERVEELLAGAMRALAHGG